MEGAGSGSEFQASLSLSGAAARKLRRCCAAPMEERMLIWEELDAADNLPLESTRHDRTDICDGKLRKAI